MINPTDSDIDQAWLTVLRNSDDDATSVELRRRLVRSFLVHAEQMQNASRSVGEALDRARQP